MHLPICTGPSITADCNKPETAQSKCYHCGNNLVNYRGCETIEELQKMGDIKNKLKMLAKITKTVRMDIQIAQKTLKVMRKRTIKLIDNK